MCKWHKEKKDTPHAELDVSILNGIAAFGGGMSALARSAAEDAATPRGLLNSVTPDAPVAPDAATAPGEATAVTAAAAPGAAAAAASKLALVTKAIYGQESGSGDNTSTSVTGAKGGMQIQPATFQQYAKPGESIDNPADNLAVGQRIIADLWQKSGGDPARVAVGYFSGPGNIAPPDSPTPWIRNAADPTGKTVAGYVSDILKRVGSS